MVAVVGELKEGVVALVVFAPEQLCQSPQEPNTQLQLVLVVVDQRRQERLDQMVLIHQ